MGRVKSAFQIAMEKADAIAGMSEDEKGSLREHEVLRTLLAAFYRGDISRDSLWQQMKALRPAMLREAQLNIINSLRLGSPPEEFMMRKDGILAIESLKPLPDMTGLEGLLGSMAKIQKEYLEIREGAIAELRHAIENNPQMRVRPMKTPDGRTVYQTAVSVDEALQTKLAEFLPEHEMRYEALFTRAAERLRTELR